LREVPHEAYDDSDKMDRSTLPAASGGRTHGPD
jgi:hypothetical protein